MTDNDNVKRAVPSEPIPVGFPWALVIQILMAILTYLIQRALTKTEREYFSGLKTELSRAETFRQGEKG